MTFDTAENGRITEIEINSTKGGVKKNYINVMVARTSFLLRIIQDAIQHGYTSFGRDILSTGVKTYNLYGYKLEGYYASIPSLCSYFDANMALLNKSVRSEVFGDRDVYTKVNDSSPAKIAEGAIVKNSVVFQESEIAQGSKLNCVIADKQVRILENRELSGHETHPYYIAKNVVI